MAGLALLSRRCCPSGGRAVAELYKALKEDGGLQKHVEGWKEGLEKQSVALGWEVPACIRT